MRKISPARLSLRQRLAICAVLSSPFWISPAAIADEGGSCCIDLEDRIAELELTTVRGGVRSQEGADHELKIKGAVDAQLVLWTDRESSGSHLAQDTGEFEFEAETELESGWKFGMTMVIDMPQAPLDEATQFGINGAPDAAFHPDPEVTELSVAVEHKRLGSLELGLLDSATDDIDNTNLSNADVIGDAGASGWNAGFFLREANPSDGDGLLELSWGDFIDGNLLGVTGTSVLVTTAPVRGFEFSAAYGTKADNDGHYWDAALRYGGKWRDIQIAAGIGYLSYEIQELDASEPTDDRGWGGSIAAFHLPTGLNIAFNYSTMSHTDACEEPGEVSGSCRGDDHVYYVKGGVVRTMNSWGPTSFYGEFYYQTKDANSSDGDVLAALEREEETATELSRSTAHMWGFGVVQAFRGPAGEANGSTIETVSDPFLKRSEVPMELYIGYRRYSLDVDLIDDGGAVAAKKLDDLHMIVSGITVRF